MRLRDRPAGLPKILFEGIGDTNVSVSDVLDASTPWDNVHRGQRRRIVPIAVKVTAINREIEMSIQEPTPTNSARTDHIDTKLEVVFIPVSDVDRAKSFYTGLGWRLDAD
ncbi:glyoxalase, partial [Rhizobium leguminosarum]